jgi:hypothetical protein
MLCAILYRSTRRSIKCTEIIDLKKMVLPGVYPLKGVVMKCYQQFYSNGDASFPPPGMSLEVSYHDMREEVLGTFQRANCDVAYLAWLMLLQNVCDDNPKLGAFVKSAQTVSMNFRHRANEAERLWAVYQLKEHEEAAADMLGHSVLARSRELASIQAQRRYPPVLQCFSNIFRGDNVYSRC